MAGSTSTKTGVAPAMTTVVAEATKENAEVMTSSPGATPTAFRASSSASVPEPVPTPWRAPHEGGQLALERLPLGPEDEAAGVEHAGVARPSARRAGPRAAA